MADGPEPAAPPEAPAALPAEDLRLRIAELEARVADERARAATKAREVERGMQILRSTLQDLQTEFQKGNEERDRLRAELQVRDEQLARARTNLVELADRAAGEGRTEEMAADLAATRDTLTSLRVRLVEVEQLLVTRERELVEARDAAATFEIDAARVRDELAAAKASAAAVPTSPGAASPAPVPSATAAQVPVRAAAGPAPAEPPPLAVVADDGAGGAGPSPTARPADPPRVDPCAAAAPAGPGADDADFPEIAGLRIERLVEQGPGGSVYDGREVATRRAVTVLVLPALVKLLDGARLESLLLAKHPNLVVVLAFGACRLGPYLVMERCEAEAGDAWVQRIGPLPEKTALAVTLEAARGLRQAAAAGALHGDLSPGSVLVDAEGRVRIHGTGLRPVVRPHDAAPLAPEFASPERLAGEAGDARSDVYSLGAVLWFLLTGSPPVVSQRGASPGPGPDIREAKADVSEETAKLLRRMLSGAPDQRHRTWDQLLIDLEHRQPGVVSPELRSNFESRARRALASRPWILLLLIAVPAFAALGLFLATSRENSPEDRWEDARERARILADEGRTEEARQIYRRFLQGVGDPSIEAEAARRYEQLARR